VIREAGDDAPDRVPVSSRGGAEADTDNDPPDKLVTILFPHRGHLAAVYTIRAPRFGQLIWGDARPEWGAADPTSGGAFDGALFTTGGGPTAGMLVGVATVEATSIWQFTTRAPRHAGHSSLRLAGRLIRTCHHVRLTGCHSLPCP